MVIVNRYTRLRQSSLQKKAFYKELVTGVLLLALISMFSVLITKEPSVQDVSAAFMANIPVESRPQYQESMTKLMTNDPSLAGDVNRWKNELQNLAVYYTQ